MSSRRERLAARRTQQQIVVERQKSDPKQWTAEVLYQALHLAKDEASWRLQIRRMSKDFVRVRVDLLGCEAAACVAACCCAACSCRACICRCTI